MAGQAAARAAMDGATRKMVTLVRGGSGRGDYTCTTGLADLSVVANGEKMVPRAYINERGNHITKAMRDYVTPLLRGEVAVPVGPDGLPVYVRLEKHRVEPRTSRYSVE
jgi:6-phosphofructokinase 1